MVRQNGHEGVVTVAMWVVNPRRMREGYGSLSVCVCVCACVCVRACSKTADHAYTLRSCCIQSYGIVCNRIMHSCGYSASLVLVHGLELHKLWATLTLLDCDTVIAC